MTASVQAWNEHISGSSMDEIEEGLLDETDNTTLKFHEKSTAFTKTTEHSWKELVSDPSFGDFDLLGNSKPERQESNFEGGTGRKDWDQYLSALSLNDENAPEFMALEVHTDDVKENEFSKATGMMATADTAHGLKETSKLVRRPNSVPLRTSIDVDRQSLINPMDKSYPPMSNANSHWQTEPMTQPTSGKTIGLTEKQTSVEERNVLPTHVNYNSPDAINTFNSTRNFSSTNSGVISNISEGKTRKTRPKSALDAHDHGVAMNSNFPKHSRAISAPLWQDADMNMQTPNLFYQTGHVRLNKPIKIDNFESSLDERKISGADDDMLDKSRALSRTSSAVIRNPTGSDGENTRVLQKRLAGNVSSDAQMSNLSARTNSSFVRETTGRTPTDEIITGKKSISVEDFTHSSGDGMYGQKSDSLTKPKETSVGETELKRSREDDNRHSIVENESKIWDNNEETGSAMLADLRLNTNLTSSDTQQLSTMNTLDHLESTPDISNIAPSREAAENLPVRPLTIGNSLNIGSSLAYQPISPFQPDLYPTGSASPIPMVPSTTSVGATNFSASQYSEGMLDEEEGGDMSARERLQPLGRDGLEVKQGPPWGITMPLFQPDSRNSSLSSNDSNFSNSQFGQLQNMSSQPSNLEIEPQQSVSSSPSETDLSRKASLKSLEPKEPMGVKMLNGAGNFKTPIGKFRLDHNNVDGDSPVSKILGPTFKATQKMLEELQRMPLGYDEDLEQPPVEKMATETTTNKYDSETSVESRNVVADRSIGSGSYDVLQSDVHNESSHVEGNRSTQDRRHSQGSRHSHDSSISREKIEKPTHDSYREVSTNQPTPDLTPTHLGVVDNVYDLQRVRDSRPSSREEIENPTRGSFHELIDQRILDLTPKTTANIERANNTRGPVVSQKVGDPERVIHGYVGSHSWRNESHKTSGITDSTLGNSIGLSGHVVPAGGETNNQGSEGAAMGNVGVESLVLEDRNDTSDMSEFDRVASESISRSNTVANQFREEMKSVNLEAQGRFPNPEDDQTLVDEPGTTTPNLDSGLSDSTTNDEIYQPKGLTRLSAGKGPIGMYDVRQSSGPGSTNRKRLALGRKPRESHYSLQLGGIYVSDGSKRKSRQSRHTKDSRIHGGVYVSEGTTSGTEAADNGIDSEPEGQSTPISEDISARESNGLATSLHEFSAKENGKSMTDMYLGLSNFEFEKPTRGSRSIFTTNQIEKPTRLTPPSFMNYESEKISREDPPAFSSFEIGKPLRANSPGALRNGNVTEGSAVGTKVLAGSQMGSNVMRLQQTAKVEHTWSISKPVMSQLSTNVSPLVIHEVDQEPKGPTQQQTFARTEQRTTHSPDHRRKRGTRYKETKETVPKPARQHSRYQSSESMESGKIRDRSGTIRKKKSVADIILENMIQEEQEQKKRYKKLQVKQVQTTQDLNQLWERFQQVVGKKSRTNRHSRPSQVARSRPSREISSREITSTDISVASSSDSQFTENRKSGGRTIDISTDSDEEFERFLRRIREIQSGDSTSYLEDNGNMISRPSSSKKRMTHDHSESQTTPSERLRRKPDYKAVDSSTSMTSIASSDNRQLRRNGSQVPSGERLPRKASRQNVDSPVVESSSVTERKSEVPVSLPMWLGMQNREIIKKEKTSSSCTCGAKARKEKQNTSGVRDIGVNCPTPPIVGQELMPLPTDIAMLKAGPLEVDILSPAPGSLVKLTLQDAFMYSKHEFIERSRERVKKVKEKHEERKTEKMSSAHVVVVVPSEKTKSRKENKKPDEDRLFDMNPNKQFEQLLRKKPRPMTTKEIRDVNKRMYKNLPEVRKKKDEERLASMYKTNRLRAQLYGKHVRNTNRIFTAA